MSPALNQHTGGPWVVLHDEVDDSLTVESAAGVPLFDNAGKLPLERMIANARVAAAAPELFDALALYVAACGNTAASVDRELVQLAWQRARAAIAKATGNPESGK